MSINAMKQALEVLEDFVDDPRCQKQIDDASIALRQALSEAQLSVNENSHAIEQAEKQKPVAKVVLTETLELPCLQWLDLNRQFDFKGGEYLYTTPLNPMDSIKSSKTLDAQPQREWVGLTEWEVIEMKAAIKGTLDVQFIDFASAIEAKLKEKNT